MVRRSPPTRSARTSSGVLPMSRRIERKRRDRAGSSVAVSTIRRSYSTRPLRLSFDTVVDAPIMGRMPHPFRLAGALAVVVLLCVVLRSEADLAAAGEATRMLRSPAVSATHVAFGYANNIWVVE